ncbi:hypothetical protein OSB04_007991, partial [Centaurea solstitialis]
MEEASSIEDDLNTSTPAENPIRGPICLRHLYKMSWSLYKKLIAYLLYHRISSFLNNKNMKPVDKLFENIDNTILGCKIDILVFSPRCYEFYFCLHELALTWDSKKNVIPDVKPSNHRGSDSRICLQSETKMLGYSLEEAKNTLGLAFDTTK